MGKKLSGIPTVERLLNLSMFLISEKYPLTLRQIVSSVEGYAGNKDFEANRRMFFRDKKDLLLLGLDIKVVKTQDPLTGHTTDGYIIDEEDFYLTKISFTPAEADALAALAGRFADPPGPHPLPELDWAVMKLTGGERKYSGDSPVLVRMDGPGRRPPQRLLDALRRAVTDRRRITIKYSSAASGRTSSREIEPYGLMIRRGLWYLYGYCLLRKDERMFRVDRIEALEKPASTGARASRPRDPENPRTGGGPDFELPAGFSISRALRRRAPWEFGADAAKEAVVQFHKDTYWLVKNNWADLESVKFDDRRLTMAAQSVNDAALVHWALEFADRAEVLSPPALRKKMKEILAAIAAW